MMSIRLRTPLALFVPAARGVAIVAGSMAAVAGTLGWPDTWVTVVGVILVVAGAVPVLWEQVVEPLRAWRRAGEESQDRLKSILQVQRPTAVAETDPYAIGVFPSELANEAVGSRRPPYVPREIDDRLDCAFERPSFADNQGLVVIRGDPKTGKSRTLWEALQRNVPNRILYPLRAPLVGDSKSPEDHPFDTFLGLGLKVDGVDMVLWIEDALDHLPSGLTQSNLRRLVERYPGVVVAMTIHAHELKDIHEFDHLLEHRLRKVSQAHVLDVRLTERELVDARRLYPGLADNDELGQLPEWFASVNLLRDRYRDSRHTEPFGVAVAKAAIDWRRAGVSAAISRVQLQQLAAIEFEQLAPNQRFTDDGFLRGLTWAVDEVARWASLVQPVAGTDHAQFRAFDAVVNWASTVDGPIDERCLQFIAESAPMELSRPFAVTDSRRVARLGGDLQEALSEDGIKVLFQPKVEMATGIVRGAEALVRWNHPTIGRIRPTAVVRIAERNDLIRSLTKSVIQAALSACQSWRSMGWDLGVSVNLSARNLVDSNLPTDIAELLNEYSVPASALTLEFNENMVIGESQRSIEVVAHLHEMHVKLSVDDFGTGYSSLTRLRRLPMSEIKVDRSFVTNITTDDTDRAITRSILSLSRGLGLTTVAEGVEDNMTWNVLRAYGCDQAQGFHISRPLTAKGFVTWATTQGDYTLPGFSV